MSEEQPDYKVSDKRKFDAQGNLREGAPREDAKSGVGEERHEPVPEPEELGGKKKKDEGKPGAGTGDKDAEQVGVTFSTFILSLGTQAMIGLGVIPDPYTNETTTDLVAAKQMIDILVLLREKTRGNLEAGEITLLDNLIFDLQMHYVELSSKKS
jgi:hypothetical protein